MLDGLRTRVPLGGASRVLDLACGTGQVAFALAGHLAEVVAVDQEAEAVAFGRAKAERLGVTGIRWVAAAAEDVALETLPAPDTASRPAGSGRRREWMVAQRWSIESLLGIVYSTSFLDLTVLGARRTAFEDDVRARLLAACPDGVFDEDASYACDLARRPRRSRLPGAGGRVSGPSSPRRPRSSGR